MDRPTIDQSTAADTQGHEDFNEYGYESPWSMGRLPTERGSAVGLLGGTFDPVHLGHLHLALSVYYALRLQSVRLIPSGKTPLREQVYASPEERVALLEMAIADQPMLSIDRSELQRVGVSYTIDTLRELRRSLGSEIPLCLIIGVDQFSQFNRWRAWWEFPELTHIVVTSRANHEFVSNPELQAWLAERQIYDFQLLHQKPSGYVYWKQFMPVAISATEIRALLRQGRDISHLVPQKVGEYLMKSGLYSRDSQQL